MAVKKIGLKLLLCFTPRITRFLGSCLVYSIECNSRTEQIILKQLVTDWHNTSK